MHLHASGVVIASSAPSRVWAFWQLMLFLFGAIGVELISYFKCPPKTGRVWANWFRWTQAPLSSTSAGPMRKQHRSYLSMPAMSAMSSAGVQGLQGLVEIQLIQLPASSLQISRSRPAACVCSGPNRTRSWLGASLIARSNSVLEGQRGTPPGRRKSDSIRKAADPEAAPAPKEWK